MADVRVLRGSIEGGRITALVVALGGGLPERRIDRSTALAWLADGHSLVPMVGGRRGPALLRVEVGEAHVIRTDGAAVDEDRLPELPAA